MTHRVHVWDAFVRMFHWLLAGFFITNAFLTNPEGSIHRWIGYAIAALVVARIIWGFAGTRHARFASFPPSASASLAQISDMLRARRNAHPGHSPLGALMIYNLLLTIVAICVTGYMMTTVAFFGVDWVEEVHEALVTWAEISVVLHVAAVVFESMRLKVNLMKSMIVGYKDLRQ